MTDVKTAPIPKITAGEPAARKDKGLLLNSAAQAGDTGPTADPDSPQPQPSASAHESEARLPDTSAGQEEKERITALADKAIAGNVQLLHSAVLLTSQNVEHALASANMAWRAVGEAASTAVELSQKNLDQMTSLLQRLSEVRTITELVSLQQEHTRVTIENLFDQGTRLSSQLGQSFGDILANTARQQEELAGSARRVSA